MPLQLWDELEEEFTLYGIRSKDLSETRFIFNINKLLGYQFHRVNDLDIYFDSQAYCFSLYCHENIQEDNSYYIIRNQSHTLQIDHPEGLLFNSYTSTKTILNKHKVFDYLLKLPYNKDEIKLNLLPLADTTFIQKVDVIDVLTTKEKKLLFI